MTEDVNIDFILGDVVCILRRWVTVNSKAIKHVLASHEVFPKMPILLKLDGKDFKLLGSMVQWVWKKSGLDGNQKLVVLSDLKERLPLFAPPATI